MPSFEYIDRLVQNQLKKATEHEVITLILGARQVGKTTLIKFIRDTLDEKDKAEASSDIGDLNEISFSNEQRVFDYNLDDINLRAALKKDILHLQKDVELSLGQPISKLEKQVYIFIDEIQKFPLLLDWVKQVFDDYSDKVKFFLTGSSSQHIRQASAETLAGRIEYVNVYPLSFTEVTHAKTGGSYKFLAHVLHKFNELANTASDPAEVTEQVVEHFRNMVNTVVADAHRRKQELEQLLQNHLFFGGLPRVFNAEADQKIKMINSYIQVYLEKEIAALSKNIDLELFGLSLKAFAMSNGKKLNLVKISKQIGISRPSLYNYLELLETTFLGKKIYPLRSGKESVSSINLYILDTGILNNLNYINSFAEMQMRDNYDKTVASWVLSNTMAQFSLLDNPPDIVYWQDYFKHKIDFVIPTSFVDIGIILRRDLSDKKLEGILSAFYKKHKKDSIILVPQLNLREPIQHKEETMEFGKYKAHIFKVPLYLWG